MRGATTCGKNTEATTVRESIQHGLSLRNMPKQCTVLSLVKKKAGFLSSLEMHNEATAILCDCHKWWWFLPPEHPGSVRKTFLMSYCPLAFFIEPQWAEKRNKGIDDQRLQVFSTESEKLAHQIVAIHINNETG